MENRAEVVTAVERNPSLVNLGCSSNAIRAARDPRRVAGALRQAGLPALEIEYAMTNARCGDWIIKPFQSGGGLGVRLPDGCRFADDIPLCYLQRYVKGPVFGASFTGHEGGCSYMGYCAHLTNLPPSPPFRYEGSVGPLEATIDLRRRLQAIGDCLCQQFRLRGWFGVDFVIEEGTGQVFLLEINPRFTASMEILDGRAVDSVFSEHLKAFAGWHRGREDDPSRSAQACKEPLAAKQILYNDSHDHLRIDHVTSDRLWQLNQASGQIVRDVPQPNWSAATGSPLCTVWAEGQGVDETLRQLQENTKTVASILNQRPHQNCDVPGRFRGWTGSTGQTGNSVGGFE
jgi:predicted ATP-grasp superfamily ATP-dependent carboligase